MNLLECRRAFRLICLAVAIFSPLADLLADDLVVVATGENRQGRRHSRGQIIEYTGKELVLRQTSGRNAVIPSDRVIEIQTEWTKQQTLGDRLFGERKFDDALAQYRAAARAEQRRWARRGILAQIVWCHRARGEMELAGSEFLNLFASDPSTQYFDAIPLAWGPQQPTVTLQRTAQAWLENSSPAPARLMGASLLLSTDRARATQALRQLTTDADTRVALLAEAQLWRIGVVTASAADVARWLTILPRIPTALRAGPYLTIGRALARQHKHEQAALTLMRVPILYARDYRLSAEAILTAADQLEKAQQREEAIGLYRELVADFTDTRPATEAEGRLQALSNETTQ